MARIIGFVGTNDSIQLWNHQQDKRDQRSVRKVDHKLLEKVHIEASSFSNNMASQLVHAVAPATTEHEAERLIDTIFSS